MTSRVPLILEATFEPTLNMITKDFAEYPEIRTGFYNMLRTMNVNCFSGTYVIEEAICTNDSLILLNIALLELEPAQFKLFVDSIVWGFKHTMRDIADTSLRICEELFRNIHATNPNIAGAFYQAYYLSILQDIFFVLTDRDHKSGMLTSGIIRS